MTPPSRSLTTLAAGLVAALCLYVAADAEAAVIINVVETGGDNEATDTIPAKWTGQTWTVTVAGEPAPGQVVGQPFTLGSFANGLPTFVDRNHRFLDDPGTGGNSAQPIPAYLLGLEYVMSGNDNRDNATYNLAITVGAPTRVFMLIDNRLSDGDNSTPPTFDATHMQWIIDEGWLATDNGLNRFSNPGVPDEVPIDEASDNTINQWYSVYYKDYPAGTFNLRQADNAGNNMYGAVVQQIVPEPAGASLCVLGAIGLLSRRRRR
jgi:hypothetical protein